LSASTTFVVFGAGAILMALEMLAFRVVAKNFGSALREFSAVIAVFLGAMSAGYALGGMLGDRRPAPSTLAAVLAGGGVLTLLIPMIEEPVAAAVFDSSLPLATHAAVVSAILFAVPACFIASVTPIAVRLRMASVESSGSLAGRVSAISTIGSIVGTVVGGYVLIGYLHISSGISLLGLLLCGLGIAATRSSRAVGCLAIVALLGARSTLAEPLYEADSAYHHIVVRQGQTKRTLHFNRTLQGSISLEDHMKGYIPYTGYVHNAFVIAPEIRSVLVIGLGSATVPRHVLHHYPDTRVTVVEIDPVVVELARKYFFLEESPRLRVETIDGRVFLKRTSERFDLVMVDAFGADRYGLTVPPHLTTREFFEEVKAKMTAGGIFVFNAPQQMPSAGTNAIWKTVAAVFPEQYVFNTHDGISCLVMGVVTPRKLSQADLVARGRAALEKGSSVPYLVDRLERLQPLPDEAAREQAQLLTDDFAPVDRLLRGR
jgi:spermidine synthase